MRILTTILAPILYVVSFLFPKTKRVWLFGGWFGKRYADNSKDFFEYCNTVGKNRGIRYIWIYKDKAIKQEVASRGFESIYAYSIEGIWVQLRAKVYISCINSSDFIPFLITKRNFYVQVWHGSPLKHIGLDSRKTAIRKTIDRIRFFFIDDYDIVVSPSDLVDNIYKRAFDCSADALFRGGYPRNENFNLFETETEQIRKHFGAKKTDKLIAYLPTHRLEGQGRNPFRKVLAELVSMNDRLEAANIVMVVKPHFYEKNSLADFKETSQVLIRYDMGVDLYKFLGATDALVTDYSSIIFDYELLGKNIFVYPFDFEEYVKKDRGFYHDFNEIYKNVRGIKRAHSTEELLMDLSNFEKKKSSFLNKATRYNLPFGKYSENLFEEIVSRADIK